MDDIIESFGGRQQTFDAVYNEFFQVVSNGNFSNEVLHKGILLQVESYVIKATGNIMDNVIQMSDFWIAK